MSYETDIVNRYYDALNRRDFAAYEALVSPDCVMTCPGGYESKGIEGVRAFDRIWTEAAQDFRVEVKRQFAGAGRVASENVAHGKHTGILRTPSGDLPATGRVIAGPYVGLFTIRNGKIIEQTLYFDQVDLMKQLGVFPPG